MKDPEYALSKGMTTTTTTSTDFWRELQMAHMQRELLWRGI